MSEIFERAWPVADAKAGVVIVHGLAEHTGRYEHVAAALNAAGYAAYGRDARGHGRSVGFPGDMGGDLDRALDDIVELAVRVKADHGTAFLIAHSMGTLFTLPAAARMPSDTLNGIVLSGTVGEPGPAGAELLEKGSVPPESVSRDPEVVKAYSEDPLVFPQVPQELLALAGEVTAQFFEAIPKITVPVLLVHGEADLLCGLGGPQLVHTQLVVTDKTLLTYPELYHEVFNEPERDKVLADVVGWLDKHL